MHQNLVRCAALLTLVLTTACEPTPTSTATPTSTSTSTSTSTPTPTASGGKKAMPAIETACKADSECDIYMEGSAADPCCPQCTTYKGGTKASLAAFRAACPTACPISCTAPATHAACTAGKCVPVRDNP